MTTEMLLIRHLGWLPIDDGQQLEDGRWCVLLMRDPRETIIAYATTCEEAWAAACSMAVKLSHER
jgi:hypothetical protein